MNKLEFTCHYALSIIAVIVLVCVSIYVYEIDYMQLILTVLLTRGEAVP